MSGPELEFHPPDGPWHTPAGAGPGVEERLLAEDPENGRRTALVRWAPGTDTSTAGMTLHDLLEVRQ
ncbi:hypothetical protein [Streptomyces sp. NPDC050538]|uniref:hypothetical protein n=1 Tax=Streptomyces sp. NPDC050538 TaxID=3365627 RepID=UPI0037BBFE2F